jgi:hypothetical protein
MTAPSNPVVRALVDAVNDGDGDRAAFLGLLARQRDLGRYEHPLAFRGSRGRISRIETGQA